jgi:hypothetical protein
VCVWPVGGLWRHVDFLKLWAAEAGSAFGGRISRTALPIIAVLSLGASPTQIAILGSLGVAPGVVIGLLVGGRVDRGAKRPLLIASDLARAALILTVPAAAWMGRLAMPQLYVVAGCVGAATTLFRIAHASLLPSLVEAGQLVEGNARLEATDAVAEAAGPGIAGGLVQLLTAPMAMCFTALTYGWSAWMISRIRSTERPTSGGVEPGGMLDDVAKGFAASVVHPAVRRLLIGDALASLFGGFFMALYMILALRLLALSPAITGMVISVGGLGAFAGAAIAGLLGRRLGVGPAMVVSLAVGQAANLFIPISLHAGPWAVPALLVQQFFGDAFLVAFAIHAVSLRQRVIPEAILGRVNATFHVAVGLTLPLGALAAGPLAGVIGVSATLWIGACGSLLAIPALFGSSVWRQR